MTVCTRELINVVSTHLIFMQMIMQISVEEDTELKGARCLSLTERGEESAHTH